MYVFDLNKFFSTETKTEVEHATQEPKPATS